MHEFTVNVYFDIYDCSSRWLNNNTYRENSNDLQSALELANDVSEPHEREFNDDDSNNSDNLVHDLELSQHPKPMEPVETNDKYDKVTYGQLCNVTSELVTAVVNDKKNSQNVVHFLTQWIRRIRLKEECAPTFIELGAIDRQVNNTTNNSSELEGGALPATYKCVTPVNCAKRLLPAKEQSKLKMRKRNKRLSSTKNISRLVSQLDSYDTH